MSLQEQTTSELQEQVRLFEARAAMPMPWEDPQELRYQAGIRQQVLTSRGIQ